MSIGTITSDPAITVKFKTGKTLGTIEESFISHIRPKSNFSLRKTSATGTVRDLTAIVTKAKTGKGAIPVWGGGKSPLSSELATAVREKIRQAREGLFDGAEMKAIRPTLALQEKSSLLPKPCEFLIERTETKEGTNWFLFPFAGRLANEGLAALVSYRMSKITPMSLSVSFNDYGFHLCSNSNLPIDQKQWGDLLSPEGVLKSCWHA